MIDVVSCSIIRVVRLTQNNKAEMCRLYVNMAPGRHVEDSGPGSRTHV